MGFGAGGGFGALAGAGGFVTIPFGAWVGSGLGGGAGGVIGSVACGTPVPMTSNPTDNTRDKDEACPTGKVKPFPGPRPTPQTTPTPPGPPDRLQRCASANADCLASSGGDLMTMARCSLSYAICVRTNLPVIFPNGIWVW